MKLALAVVATAIGAVALAASAVGTQDTKWKPFAFRGNERFDYKIVVDDGGTPKESGFGLDIQKQGEADFAVTWSVHSTVKAEELNEQTMLVGWANAAPAWVLMNPMVGMIVNDLTLKEGEKMSLFGAGTVKVTGKETFGGRTGYTCQFSQPGGDGKEVLVWEWTVDPELALPIKSIVYDNGKATSRAELTGYKKN